MQAAKVKERAGLICIPLTAVAYLSEPSSNRTWHPPSLRKRAQNRKSSLADKCFLQAQDVILLIQIPVLFQPINRPTGLLQGQPRLFICFRTSDILAAASLILSLIAASHDDEFEMLHIDA